MEKFNIPPEERTRLLMKALGWQGGTIHQLADITGCDATALLYAEIPQGPDPAYLDGHFWYTNSRQFQEESIIPKQKGNLSFWLGVSRRTQIAEINCGNK